MDVTIKIDSDKVTGEMMDMFKTMSDDDKKGIAQSVLKGWLTDPKEVETQLIDKRIIEEVRNKDDWYKKKTDAEIMNMGDYKDKRRLARSSKEAMIEEVMIATKIAYGKAVEELVKTDPQLQKVMQDELAKIKEDFPKFVHDAMIAWFCSNMQKMTDGIAQALVMSSQSQDTVRNLLQNGRGY